MGLRRLFTQVLIPSVSRSGARLLKEYCDSLCYFYLVLPLHPFPLTLLAVFPDTTFKFLARPVLLDSILGTSNLTLTDLGIVARPGDIVVPGHHPKWRP